MNKHGKIVGLLIILIAIAGAIYRLESGKPKQVSGDEIKRLVLPAKNEIKENKAAKYDAAVELVRPAGFINSEEFKLADFIGKKVILIDFWTYSCINCQRTFPYLNLWHQKYKDAGLEIIGVHTPEFEFEKNRDNVLAATTKYGIKHKVVQDNEYGIWRAYNNRYWPAKYLIDIDGYIVFKHFGEGMYEETEAKIVELLNERKARLGEASISLDMEEPEQTESVNYQKVYTPETYLGSDRVNAIANLLPTCLARECEYKRPATLFINTFALDGFWRMEPEFIELTKEQGSIIIRFSANKVNLVAGSNVDKEIKAEIYLDGKLVPGSVAGAVVDGGEVNFSGFDLYNLIDLRGDYGTHTLEIKILEPGLEVYAFTFG